MRRLRPFYLTFGLWICLSASLSSQNFFAPVDSFHKGRFWGISSFTTVAYTGTVIGLNELWYKDYERSKFHTFNDWGEWLQMDKMGHAFTAYFEASYTFDFARWTGMKRKPAVWTSAALAMLFQTTVEVFDGYSDAWGFSTSDMAFNALGAGFFVAQELIWEEQRILWKVSNRYPNYDQLTGSGTASDSDIKNRAEELYGGNFASRLLKDYNGQTIWLSINPRSFFPTSKWPSILNVAVGYGTENVFGARSNTWTVEDIGFSLSANDYPRHRQFFLSLDLDLRRIKVKKPIWKLLLRAVNVFKIPSPALEWNVGQGIKVRPLYF